MQGKTFFFRFCLSLIFCFSILSTTAQEDCSNGIDDDNDGLVDLNDPDCQCSVKTPGNILMNSSFEQYKHCPIPPWVYYLDHDIVNGWEYGVQPSADIFFYYNLACPDDSINLFYNHPQITIPDGKAMVILVAAGFVVGQPESTMSKRYIAQCLRTPLVKDKNYTLAFKVSKYYYQRPISVGLFGHANCSAVPFGNLNVNNGCPMNFPGWVNLGSGLPIYSLQTWQQQTIQFTPPQDMNVIEIGVDCELLDGRLELYFDDLQLSETKDFNPQYITVREGNACSGGYVLAAPAFNNAAYAWYKNGIAIDGAKSNTYTVPNNSVNGDYIVRIDTGGNCILTQPLTLKAGNINEVKMPADTFICDGANLILGNGISGIKYSWNNNTDTVVRINQAGGYFITATDSLGCGKNFTVQVSNKQCAGCTVFIPTAFTPNGDGLNDVLKGTANCGATEFYLQVFNRWGNKIFESKDINKGWDGTVKSLPATPGVYAYIARFKTASGDTELKTIKGTVMLLR